MAAQTLQNTFTGANMEFQNEGIHSLLSVIAKHRKQLTTRSEFKQQSGWNNEMNIFMQKGLLEIDRHVRRIVYNPDGKTQEALEANAADTTRTIKDDFNASSLRADDVLQPTVVNRPIVHILDGSDPNMPQPTPDMFPNDHARVYISGLDRLFVEATRLDSRFDLTMVTKYEGVMLHNMLEKLWAITEVFGGEANRADTPNGTLPADEPKTFLGAATK